MSEYVFTSHAKDMLKEREIMEQWVLQTIRNPDKKMLGNDGNTHYFRLLPERKNHVLHVVINETLEPNRIVTLFLTGEKGKEMRLKIDKENDALYFRLDESAIVESEEVQPGVILDFDKNNQVVGIEILNLSARVGQEKINILQLETV